MYLKVLGYSGGSDTPIVASGDTFINTADKQVDFLVELEDGETYAGILSNVPDCQPGSTVTSTKHYVDPTDSDAFFAMKKPSGTWDYKAVE